MTTLLVTGGAGFIGSNFIKYYLENHKKDNIINLDKLTYAANKNNLKGVEKSRHKFVEGDICDSALVDKLSKKAETIVNFAAESHVDRAIKSAENFIKTNIYGTYVLLEAARRNKITKFIQISTDEVYGEIQNGKASETFGLNPGNPYSASKASADLLALSYYNTYRLPVMITRTCNNFGPYQNNEKLIPFFITNLMQNKKMPLYGDGQNIREWIYVLDNCEAIDFIMKRGKTGEIYNIGTGVLKKNIEVAKFLIKAFGRDDLPGTQPKKPYAVYLRAFWQRISEQGERHSYFSRAD